MEMAELKILKNMECEIDAKSMHYRKLNGIIKELIKNPGIYNPESLDLKDANTEVPLTISLKNIIGQRYIGDAVKGNVKIKIHGVPGNDMAAFMDGPEIEVFGNVQDGVANTMNSGKIIVHGSSGDITGYSMRGGEIYIRDNVGWRSGIHMKSYLEKFPVIVIGGKAGNFLGEYMAGGVIIVLGLGKHNDENPIKPYYFERFYCRAGSSAVGDFAGTGMHGGKIFICGDIEDYKTGKEVKKMKPDDKDISILKFYISNYCSFFKADYDRIAVNNFKNFIKLAPYSHRPYGKLYAY